MPNFVHLLTGSDPQEGLAYKRKTGSREMKINIPKPKSIFYEIETLQREELR